MARNEMQIMATLHVLCRLYHAFQKANTRLTNQTKAISRLFKGFQEKGFSVDERDEKLLKAHFETAREPIKKQLSEFERQIGKAAMELRVWPWVESIRGVGPLGLGLVVGYAGDLSNYPDKSKLNKRFGVSPGQRRVKDKALAKELGYSPFRRSVLYNLSESLMKQNWSANDKGDKVDGVYRETYLKRKAYLEEKHPEWKLLKKPTPFEDEPHGEAKDAKWKYHREALRYIGKKFLKDLLREWKRLHPEAKGKVA